MDARQDLPLWIRRAPRKQLALAGRAAGRRVRSVMSCMLVSVLGAASIGTPASHVRAQPPSSSGEQLSISVITFGRGDAVHQYFGHNAFVIEAPSVEQPSATVFNYGMFTFGPGMIPQFLKGRLHFWVGATELQQTAAQYARANRDVRLLELNLSPTARAAVFARLLHDVRPENREYLYDHYFDNCSTRVRDILDAALHGQLRRAWSVPSQFTLRDQTRRYTQHDPLTEWSIASDNPCRLDQMPFQVAPATSGIVC